VGVLNRVAEEITNVTGGDLFIENPTLLPAHGTSKAVDDARSAKKRRFQK
jgi:hypothetical protein